MKLIGPYSFQVMSHKLLPLAALPRLTYSHVAHFAVHNGIECFFAG